MLNVNMLSVESWLHQERGNDKALWKPGERVDLFRRPLLCCIYKWGFSLHIIEWYKFHSEGLTSFSFLSSIYIRGQQTFSCRGLRKYILGFAGHVINGHSYSVIVVKAGIEIGVPLYQ